MTNRHKAAEELCFMFYIEIKEHLCWLKRTITHHTLDTKLCALNADSISLLFSVSCIHICQYELPGQLSEQSPSVELSQMDGDLH